ncbi:MAG: heat-inducible transcriptional repressor HrcA [Dehalococcoidia bacterium]
MTLSERRAAILRLIISDYVQTAQPVGSEALVQRHSLELSSATIRNEMARLEEEGYITHPHTSAGRVPSDRGYRYYIEALMGEPELPPEERLRILHQFHQATSEVAEWLQLAASVLAQSVRNVAVVTAPRGNQARLKHLELVSLQDFSALLVLVTQDIKVRQQVITFLEPVNQEDLARLSNRINHLWSGLDAEQIAARLGELPPRDEPAGRAVRDILAEEEHATYSDARVEGLRNVLEQPEFSRSTRALEIMEALDDHNLSEAIPFDSTPDDGVTVIIGAENRRDAMRECSVIIAAYGGAQGAKGSLVVLGPTRMHYPRAIATVRYMGGVMSELLKRLYGHHEEQP